MHLRKSYAVIITTSLSVAAAVTAVASVFIVWYAYVWSGLLGCFSTLIGKLLPMFWSQWIHEHWTRVTATLAVSVVPVNITLIHIIVFWVIVPRATKSGLGPGWKNFLDPHQQGRTG